MGTYVYICDGTTPGSPVLSDGHALYTPGLSERRAGVSSFYADDKLGNLWIVNGTGTTQSYYQDTTGFGALTASGGSSATPFKFGGGNGCQTDADTGLVLMGHRYYDSRTGRFISQDPAKDGTDWYTYCGNNPVGDTDPSGLVARPFEAPVGTPEDQIIKETMDNGGLPGEQYSVKYRGEPLYTFTIPDWFRVQLVGVPYALALPSDFNLGNALAQADRVKANSRPVTGSIMNDKYFRHSGRLSWIVGKFATGHIWDFKNKKGIPGYLKKEAENAGNVVFGIILARLGVPQVEASDGAGGAELVDHPREAFGNYMDNDKDWRPSAFDNPIDEAQIKAGYGWYYGSYGGIQP